MSVPRLADRTAGLAWRRMPPLAFASGSCLGPYEITAQIGVGDGGGLSGDGHEVCTRYVEILRVDRKMNHWCGGNAS